MVRLLLAAAALTLAGCDLSLDGFVYACDAGACPGTSASTASGTSVGTTGANLTSSGTSASGATGAASTSGVSGTVGVGTTTSGDVSSTSGVASSSSSGTSGVTLTALAGSGNDGDRDGMALQATFDGPEGLFAFGDELFIAESGFNADVRALSLDAGLVSTLCDAGEGLEGPTSLYVTDGGVLWIGDEQLFYGTLSGAIQPLNANYPASFNPEALAFDGVRTFYIADMVNNCLETIDTVSAAVTLFAGTCSSGTNGEGFQNGPVASALFAYPSGLAFDPSTQELFVSDRFNNLIRRISAGAVSTLAGTGDAGETDGPNGVGSLFQPTAMRMDSQGNLYVVDAEALRKVVRLSDGGAEIQTVVSLFPTISSAGDLTFSPDETALYISDNADDRIYVVRGF